MIRAAIIALALSASPASANIDLDINSTNGIIYIGVASIVCGIRIPDVAVREFKQISTRYGFNEREFAEAIATRSGEISNQMSNFQKDEFCKRVIRAYREWGVLK